MKSKIDISEKNIQIGHSHRCTPIRRIR